ncbi:hypothetical protein A5643_15070 [Mycobacterium sp. 1274756.6]|nr:hypothetical protein A5643_15070 [Mycobacterium sp. 1274756.6]
MPSYVRLWSALILMVFGTALAAAPAADGDPLGYLINITTRPGYDFASSDEALRYGYGLCDQIAGGKEYSELAAEIKDRFRTDDEYDAAYLIGQATQELCPHLIWQVRESAAGYAPSPRQQDISPATTR